MTTIMQPLQWICNHRVKKRIELRNYAHRNNHSLQNTEEEPVTPGTTAAATAAHTRYLSSPAAATLHGQIHGFVLRLPPQNKAHATFMQTLQYISQHRVANLHLSTHMHHHMTAIMQPLQCDLQPQIQETHRTTHTGTATRCRTQRRNPLRPERLQPQPPLDTEKYTVSCSGFLPETKPMRTFMQPLQHISQQHVANLHLSTHMATPHDSNHAATPMRSATTDSRNA